MYTLILQARAKKRLKKLPVDKQKMIVSKLRFFVDSDTPLLFAKPLKKSDLGTYRFRVGDYRVVFDIVERRIVVLTIGHRKEIYK